MTLLVGKYNNAKQKTAANATAFCFANSSDFVGDVLKCTILG